MTDKQVNVAYNVDYKDIENLNRVAGELLRREKEWEQTNKAVAKSLQQITPAISKATSEIGKESAALRKSVEAQSAKIQAQDAALQKQLDWARGNERAKATNDAVTGSLKTQRQNLLQLESAINRIRNSRRQLTATQQGELAALRQTAAQQRINMQIQRQAEQAQRQAEAATKRHTDAVSGNVKKLALWAVGARTTFAVFNKLRVALRDSIQDVYGNTEEYKRLTDSVKKASNAFVLLILPFEDTKNLMGDTAGILEELADGLVSAAAWTQVWAASLTNWNDVAGVSASLILSLQAGAKAFADGQADFQAAQEALLTFQIQETIRATQENENFTKSWEDLTKELTAARDASLQESDANKEFEQALKSATNAMERFNDEAERHEQVVSNIQREYGSDFLFSLTGKRFGTKQFQVQEEYSSKIADIEADLQKRLDKINADALKAREKAIKNNHKRIAAAQQQANNDLARMIEQHELEMRFARQRYNLTNIQNERLYLYERERLLAEGDVLAIEELDARYELERQAREENFRLEQQQAEAMFQLQLRYQQEAMQQQIQALKDALAEQLAAIEEARIEERAEAEAKAEEERIKAQEKRQQELEDLKAAREEEIKEEEATHEKKLKDLAEYWAKYLAESGIGLDEGLKLFNSVMGTNGELDGIITESYKRQLQFTINFTNDYERIVGSIPEAARNAANQAAMEMQRIIADAAAAAAAINTVGAYGAGGGYYGGGGQFGVNYRHQFGGEHVVSSPTTITAGERGLRERVIVQPLSPIAASGSMSLQWSGNPIPVRGEGSLSGMDIQALADSISIGVLNKLNMTFGNRYGIRGR